MPMQNLRHVPPVDLFNYNTVRALSGIHKYSRCSDEDLPQFRSFYLTMTIPKSLIRTLLIRNTYPHRHLLQKQSLIQKKLEQSVPKDIPKTVPPKHEYRTLVLCLDGTGDQFDADNSNIIQLFSLLKKDNPSQQMVYYQVQFDYQ